MPASLPHALHHSADPVVTVPVRSPAPLGAREHWRAEAPRSPQLAHNTTRPDPSSYRYDPTEGPIPRDLLPARPLRSDPDPAPPHSDPGPPAPDGVPFPPLATDPTPAPRRSTRGQVILAIACMRGTSADQVQSSDPVIPMLLNLRAWIVDWIVARYDPKTHGELTAEAIDHVLFNLEDENILGPAVDGFS